MNNHRVRALLALPVAMAAMASPAFAGTWAYGCRGTFPHSNEALVFNRFALVEKPKALLRGTVRDLISASWIEKDAAGFEADNANSGFEPMMLFERSNPGQERTLTELSSRKISERSGRAGPRDEITTIYRKIYHYVRSDQPTKQEITMECVEYQLSTKGGRG